jgi:hypothetical protein
MGTESGGVPVYRRNPKIETASKAFPCRGKVYRERSKEIDLLYNSSKMVWCCGSVETLSPEEQVVDQNKNGTSTSYPAQRREFVPPNANAMIAGTSPNNFGHEGEDLVSGELIADGSRSCYL